MKFGNLLSVGPAISLRAQCIRMDLNKRSKPKQMTVTTQKGNHYRYKETTNWNVLSWDAITKYAKNVLGCYCRPLFCPLEWFAQKTKSDFFTKITFFTEQPILVSRKGCCSNNPKRFWHILLLRPRTEHFDLLFFCTYNGSPFMWQQSFARVLTFY